MIFSVNGKQYAVPVRQLTGSHFLPISGTAQQADKRQKKMTDNTPNNQADKETEAADGQTGKKDGRTDEQIWF